MDLEGDPVNYVAISSGKASDPHCGPDLNSRPAIVVSSCKRPKNVLLFKRLQTNVVMLLVIPESFFEDGIFQDEFCDEELQSGVFLFEFLESIRGR